MATIDIIAVLSTFVLGYLAHRLYESLRKKGVIQHQPLLRAIVITLAASPPLILVLLYPKGSFSPGTFTPDTTSTALSPSRPEWGTSAEYPTANAATLQPTTEPSATSVQPTGSLTPSPSATILERPSDPIQFAIAYFKALNQAEYATAFSWLADSFKRAHHCCNSDGSYLLQPYIDWWGSFERVEVVKIELREQREETAIVYVYLRYYRPNGTTTEDQNFIHLIKDGGGWMISDWRG